MPWRREGRSERGRGGGAAEQMSKWWRAAVGVEDLAAAGEVIFPVIDIAGSPFEMGQQHGQQLGARILRTVAELRRVVSADEYDASFAAFGPTVAYCRAAVPDLVEEMEGVAEGSGLPFKDIWMANAQLDTAVWLRSQPLALQPAPGGELPGCSSHAVSAAGTVCLGWNGDDRSGWMDTAVVVRGRPASGRPFAYCSWAGTVGRPGLSHTIAVGANSLPTGSWQAEGLLYPMVCRLLFECADAEAAAALFSGRTAIQTCSQMNYMLADPAGGLLDVETDGCTAHILRPRGATYLLHTNDYEHQAHLATHPARPPCLRLAAAEAAYRDGSALESLGAEQLTGRVFDVLATPPIYQDPGRSGNDAGTGQPPASETVVSMVARFSSTLGDGGDASLHICRGRAGSVPCLHVRLPSIIAPLPATEAEFAALAAPALLPAPSSGDSDHPDEEQLQQQMAAFARDGFLLLKGFYGPAEVAELRDEFHKMVCNPEGRPAKVSEQIKVSEGPTISLYLSLPLSPSLPVCLPTPFALSLSRSVSLSLSFSLQFHIMRCSSWVGHHCTHT